MPDAANHPQPQIPILRTQKLTRLVGDKYLVEDISIEVQRSDFFAVVGPSGAGKTSFLRLLNRLDEPTGGTVYLDGKDYREILPGMLRRRVGMVMQMAHLFPGTVGDNIRFGPQQRGEDLSKEHIESLLSKVGLVGYSDRDVDFLSGGEAQRVSLARTLANSPEVLLLDEPTSSLDDQSEQEVEQLILEIIQSEKLTCLMVTHDMAQAERLADRAILLKGGHLIKMGPVKEVIYA
jgi:putative ABC transport system ATP-binding protein